MRALAPLVLLLGACASPAPSSPRPEPAHSDGECDVFERACPRAELCASVELAACLETGWAEHPADVASALAIYARHCATGHLVPCREAARLSAETDRPASLAFLERACSLSPLECEALGRAYERAPSGVAPDLEKARAAYRRGCKPPGISSACDALEDLDRREPSDAR